MPTIFSNMPEGDLVMGLTTPKTGLYRMIGEPVAAPANRPNTSAMSVFNPSVGKVLAKKSVGFDRPEVLPSQPPSEVSRQTHPVKDHQPKFRLWECKYQRLRAAQGIAPLGLEINCRRTKALTHYSRTHPKLRTSH